MLITGGSEGADQVSLASMASVPSRAFSRIRLTIGRQGVFQIKDGPKRTALENLKTAGAQQAHN